MSPGALSSVQDPTNNAGPDDAQEDPVSSTPDRFINRVDAAIRSSTPASAARVDQLAALWRDYFNARGVDLSDPTASDASLRTIAMLYGLLMAAHSTGELNDDAWSVINDVLGSSTAAVTVTRSTAVQRA